MWVDSGSLQKNRNYFLLVLEKIIVLKVERTSEAEYISTLRHIGPQFGILQVVGEVLKKCNGKYRKIHSKGLAFQTIDCKQVTFLN